MARHPRSSAVRRRLRSRSWIYTISIILIAAVIVAVVYWPGLFGGNESRPDENGPKTGAGNINTDDGFVRHTTQLAVIKPEPNIVKTPPEPADVANPEVNKLIAEAVTIINTEPGRIIEARDRLNVLLNMTMSKQQEAFIKEQLTKLSKRWLFSKNLFPEDKLCGSYEVKRGDRFEIIARRYKVPYEILMKINNIPRAQALKAAQTIKVINGPFHAKVNRSTFTMDLYLQDTYVHSFAVGLGQPGRETPTGLWRVKQGGKEISPAWTDPDTQQVYNPGHPNYPLGSRWIALEGVEGPAKDQMGFGIHGTKEPETIGTAGSRGCIRLNNGEAILVYNMLVQGYSTVRVE